MNFWLDCWCGDWWLTGKINVDIKMKHLLKYLVCCWMVNKISHLYILFLLWLFKNPNFLRVESHNCFKGRSASSLSEQLNIFAGDFLATGLSGESFSAGDSFLHRRSCRDPFQAISLRRSLSFLSLYPLAGTTSADSNGNNTIPATNFYRKLSKFGDSVK